MKVLVIHGSPRRGGNSDTLADHFLKGLESNGTVEICHFYSNDLDIGYCQGCWKCENSPDGLCIHQDDMQDIYMAFIDSELIVFVTPMYWGYMTAQLKTIVDRMEPMCRYIKGKTWVALMTYRHHYESTDNFFKRITGYFGAKYYSVPCKTYDDATGKDIHISQCQGKLREAFELGLSLAPKKGQTRIAVPRNCP